MCTRTMQDPQLAMALLARPTCDVEMVEKLVQKSGAMDGRQGCRWCSKSACKRLVKLSSWGHIVG